MNNLYLNFEFEIMEKISTYTKEELQSYITTVFEKTNNFAINQKYVKILETIGLIDLKLPINENIEELETEVVSDEKEAEIRNLLLGKSLNYDINGEEQVNTATITDVFFNFNSIELLLSDGTSEMINMSELEKFLEGDELVMVGTDGNAAYGLSLVLDTNEGLFSGTNIGKHIILINDLKEEIGTGIIVGIQQDGKYLVANIECDCNLYPSKTAELELNKDFILATNKVVSESIESDGSLENDIANDLYPKYKELQQTQGTVSIKELENEMITHGGTLDMTDKVMSYLVGMGINFENDSINELELENELDLNENLNDFTQELPLQNEVNQNWNIFSDEDVKVKKDINLQAVERMVSEDGFLNFSYGQLRTGDKEEDLQMMYDTYIKKDDELLKKLKTYESYVKHINESAISESELTQDIELVLNDFNIESDPMYTNDLIKSIEKYTNIFETYYAVYANEFKSEFKEFLSKYTITELTNLLLDSGIKLNLMFEENSNILKDKLNISEELANFIVNLCLQFDLENSDNLDTNTRSILFMSGICFVLNELNK